MNAAESHCRRDRRMPEQNFVYLVRSDIFASADDDVFNAAGQMQIAVRIEKSLVARAEPAVHKGTRVRFGVVFVSGEYVGSLNRNFAALIGAKVIAVLVHNADTQFGP